MMSSHDVYRETFPPEYLRLQVEKFPCQSGANKEDQFWASHISCCGLVVQIISLIIIIMIIHDNV